jgi:hypothetical protein
LAKQAPGSIGTKPSSAAWAPLARMGGARPVEGTSRELSIRTPLRAQPSDMDETGPRVGLVQPAS